MWECVEREKETKCPEPKRRWYYRVCVWALKLKYFSVKLYGNYDRINGKHRRKKTKRGIHVWWKYTKTNFMIELFCFVVYVFSTFNSCCMRYSLYLWCGFSFSFNLPWTMRERERREKTHHCKFVVNHLNSTNFQFR